MDRLSNEELNAEIRRLSHITEICERRGFLDGATAAKAQLRALKIELNER